MKYLLLFFISFNLFAGFSPSCDSEKSGFFRSKSKCESVTSETCYKTPSGLDCSYHKLTDIYVNDITKPIYEAKSNVVECTDEVDCLAKEASHVCDTENGYYVIRLADNTEVYCTKFLGYEQKNTGKKQFSIDAVKKATHDTKIKKKNRRAKRVAKAQKKMNCGQSVIALIVDRNGDKTLTQEQVIQLSSSYKDVMSLLSTGSLDTAKAVITAMTPDGVIMTDEDKTEALELLVECM